MSHLAKGVSDQFLRILENERRLAIRHVGIGAALALVALFMANLADEPLFGTESFAYAVALFLGVGGGLALAWWRSRQVSESIRSGWNAWMRFSVSCTRVDEVYRKAAGRRARSPAVTGVGAAALFFANAILFVLLWVDAPSSAWLGVPTVMADGIVVGGWLGSSAWRFGWALSFTKALEDLLRDGSIGLWGER